ncbi:MAG: hypothetical protein J0H69_16965 [Burkholderiales bacterium]|nr:hypothetical protein [Burkholderiales bacterium]
MAETYEREQDFGPGKKGLVRRWLMELSLAEKRDKDFRQVGKKVWDQYRGKGRRKNSFNILWSNTETLAPAVFNSPPVPNVRRRFKDADLVGKWASQYLERCLAFQTDTEPFVHNIKQDVLDMLLPGRGIGRVRYVPSLVQVGTPVPDEADEDPAHESMEGDQEELAWEQCVVEHVQWDDFRHGPGKTWGEVSWIAFRHRFNRADGVRKFGDKFEKVTLDEPADDELKKEEDLAPLFQTAEVWEIWDKEERKVYFIAKSYKDEPLQEMDDPLGLGEFFPIPRPLYAIQDSSCLDPVALYEQYKEQAEELNRISTRINKIIDALKVRGIYDSTLGELAELMRADDNDLVPAQEAAKWAQMGGLEKAIWMMPMESAAKALQILYQQREATKQVIYEISGIGDVMRGVSDPNETLGAQQLKSQWGGQRVGNLQREVVRYVRDIIRIMSEIIAERFQPETLRKMSGLSLPTQAEYQQQAMMAQLQGQQPPPQPAVFMDQVMEVLRDDATRTFKVDVETDSMIAATIQDDMQGLQQVLQGVTQWIQGAAPAVMSGAMPVDAVKEVMLAIVRRSKLGTAVEDALEQMKEPTPPPDPGAAQAQAEQAKLQAKQQLDQQALEHKKQMDQAALAHSQQLEMQRAQSDAQIERERMQGELVKAQQEVVFTRQLEAYKADQDRQLQVILAQIKKDTAIEVAHVNNEGKVASAEIAAANKPEPTSAE